MWTFLDQGMVTVTLRVGMCCLLKFLHSWVSSGHNILHFAMLLLMMLRFFYSRKELLTNKLTKLAGTYMYIYQFSLVYIKSWLFFNLDFLWLLNPTLFIWWICWMEQKMYGYSDTICVWMKELSYWITALKVNMLPRVHWTQWIVYHTNRIDLHDSANHFTCKENTFMDYNVSVKILSLWAWEWW